LERNGRSVAYELALALPYVLPLLAAVHALEEKALEAAAVIVEEAEHGIEIVVEH
jgi:hypothetical protein